MEESNPELESFRQQWRAEVSAKSRTDGSSKQPGKTQTSKASRRPPGSSSISVPPPDDEEAEERGLETAHDGLDPGPSNDIEGFGGKFGTREPQSALEHYEKAVEREGHGKLGDSLALYRKAFKVSQDWLLWLSKPLKLHRWTTEWMSHIRTNTSRPHLLLRSQLHRNHQMGQS